MNIAKGPKPIQPSFNRECGWKQWRTDPTVSRLCAACSPTQTKMSWENASSILSFRQPVSHSSLSVSASPLSAPVTSSQSASCFFSTVRNQNPSSSSCGSSLNGRCRFHEWSPCSRLLMENFNWDVPAVARCRQTRASWVAENQKNCLESPLGRPNMPSR